MRVKKGGASYYNQFTNVLQDTSLVMCSSYTAKAGNKAMPFEAWWTHERRGTKLIEVSIRESQPRRNSVRPLTTVG